MENDKKKRNGRKIKNFEFVIWKFGMFDRLVIKDWKLIRQNLYMDYKTGKLIWKKEKLI